jgi:hypothetical protein
MKLLTFIVTYTILLSYYVSETMFLCKDKIFIMLYVYFTALLSWLCSLANVSPA